MVLLPEVRHSGFHGMLEVPLTVGPQPVGRRVVLSVNEPCWEHDLPIGKPTELWKITIFHGKIHYFYGHFQ